MPPLIDTIKFRIPFSIEQLEKLKNFSYNCDNTHVIYPRTILSGDQWKSLLDEKLDILEYTPQFSPESMRTVKISHSTWEPPCLYSVVKPETVVLNCC